MSSNKERVLVVDDEPQILLALEDLLSDQFDILKSTSGEQALRMVASTTDIAVVISDQRMPSMTGDELLCRLKESCPATGILLTGFADVGAVARAVNSARVFAYVTKPWNSEDLRLKIQRAVEHFRLSCDLASERQLLHDLMDNVPDAIYLKDSELRFQRVNRAFAQILGGDVESYVGKRLMDITEQQDLAARVESEELNLIASGESSLDSLQPFGTNGTQRWFSISKTPFRSYDGSTQGLIGIARDITDRRRQEQRIARLTRVYAVTSGINAAIVLIHDPKMLFAESCRIAVETGGFGVAAVLSVERQGTKLRLLSVYPGDSPVVREASPGLDSHDFSDSSVLQQLVYTRAPVILNNLDDLPDSALKATLVEHGLHSVALFPLIVDGTLLNVFALASDRERHFDVEEVKLLRELADNLSYALSHIEKTRRLEFLAYHDELTGLPNRTLLLDRLTQQIASARRNEAKLAVLVLDIARLRQVNETLGHSGGDTLLLQIARRLQDVLPKQVTLARMEGSAFAVLLPEVSDESTAAVLVQSTILQASRDSFTVNDTELRIAFRVGIALFPADSDQADSLLGKAENALKNAKARAQSYMFYAPSMNERVAEKLSLETKLRRAIELEEFVLHYQPKVDLKTGDVVGLEALIRWRDPESGLVAPGRFIPILEETGMILEVGRWALREASSQYHEWLSMGYTPPRIAVNVSAVQLAAPDFLETLFAVLDASGSQSGGVDLEITESVFVENLVDSVDKLQAARQRGLQVAIDDFGTGYSSLGYLTRLPVDSLKIDRSFIVGMADDPQEMAIVTTIISLAHSMDLKVIAEGVETAAQARLLRLIKCNELQGYLFSKPKPAEEIPAILTRKLEIAGSFKVSIGPTRAG
ncbi:MAG TPA: EAL domain-containing protein [Polyangiaceae bacterium]